MKNKVAVLGEGAWGSAIAMLLAHNGYKVSLWCHNQSYANEINNKRINSGYFPGFMFDSAILATHDLSEALDGAQIVFEAIPTQFLRAVLEKAQKYVCVGQVWVVMSKGIEEHTLLLSSDIVAQVMGDTIQVVALTGPSFARDLAAKKFTSAVLASSNLLLAYELQKMLSNEYFRPYVSIDLIGVQAGGALKNIMALAVGMLDGGFYSDNTKAFFFTRGLHEMAKLSVAMGGKQETIYGLSGVGDLVLTCLSGASKNWMVGKKLGMGESLDKILADTGFVPEGINSLRSIPNLTNYYHVDLPFYLDLYEVVFKNKTVEFLFSNEMNRPLDW